MDNVILWSDGHQSMSTPLGGCNRGPVTRPVNGEDGDDDPRKRDELHGLDELLDDEDESSGAHHVTASSKSQSCRKKETDDQQPAQSEWDASRRCQSQSGGMSRTIHDVTIADTL